MYKLIFTLIFCSLTHLYSVGLPVNLLTSTTRVSNLTLEMSKFKNEGFVSWTRSDKKISVIESRRYTGKGWGKVEEVGQVSHPDPMTAFAIGDKRSYIAYRDEDGIWASLYKGGVWQDPERVTSSQNCNRLQLVSNSVDNNILVWVEEGLDDAQICSSSYDGVSWSDPRYLRKVHEISELKLLATEEGRCFLAWVDEKKLFVAEHCFGDWEEVNQISFGEERVGAFDLASNEKQSYLVWETIGLGQTSIGVLKHNQFMWGVEKILSTSEKTQLNPSVVCGKPNNGLMFLHQSDQSKFSYVCNKIGGGGWIPCKSFNDYVGPVPEKVQLHSDKDGLFHAWWISDIHGNGVITSSTFRDYSKWDDVSYLSNISDNVKNLKSGVSIKGKSVGVWLLEGEDKWRVQTNDFNNICPPHEIYFKHLSEEFPTSQLSLIQVNWKNSSNLDVIKYRIYLNCEEKGIFEKGINEASFLAPTFPKPWKVSVTAVLEDGSESKESPLILFE